MRLYLNDTSPFARLVLVTALETGAWNIDLIWVDPWASPEELLSLNPFSTVPTLKLADGTALYESLLICEYLMANTDPARSALALPEHGNQAALQRLALGKSLMEFAFRKVVMEKFASSSSSGVLSERAATALVRTLNSLDTALGKQPVQQPERPNFPDLCLAVALEYVRFRLNDLFDARVGLKTLAWLAAYRARPSLEGTTPERLKTCPANLSELSATERRL